MQIFLPVGNRQVAVGGLVILRRQVGALKGHPASKYNFQIFHVCLLTMEPHEDGSRQNNNVTCFSTYFTSIAAV